MTDSQVVDRLISGAELDSTRNVKGKLQEDRHTR